MSKEASTSNSQLCDQLNVDITPNSKESPYAYAQSDVSDEDMPRLSPHKRKERSLNADSEEESERSTFSTPVRKKRMLIKTEDDAKPLPDPFILPKHFRHDVEVALKNGKMNKETMSAFLSAIASAMLVFKRYPLRDDYVNVARSVIKQYPFMASPIGTAYVRCSNGFHDSV